MNIIEELKLRIRELGLSLNEDTDFTKSGFTQARLDQEKAAEPKDPPGSTQGRKTISDFISKFENDRRYIAVINQNDRVVVEDLTMKVANKRFAGMLLSNLKNRAFILNGKYKGGRIILHNGELLKKKGHDYRAALRGA